MTAKIPTVARIDYNDFSASIHFDDIGYMTCQTTEEGLLFSIHLTFGSVVDILEDDKEMYGELKTLYLDLFTKWKNKCDVEREQEAIVMNYEGY